MPVIRTTTAVKRFAMALLFGAAIIATTGVATVATSTPAEAGFRAGWGWHHGGWRGGWHAGWGWRGGWGWHRGWGWRAGWGWHGGWGWRHAWWGGCGCGYGYYPFAVTYEYAVPGPIAGDRFTVYFEFAKSDLSNEAKAEIDNAIADAQRGAPARISILGHTDRVGRADSNVRLSERRAETVAEYMVAHGVPREAIQIRAYGESANAVPTPNGVNEPRNRRVEIIVTAPGGAPVAGGPPRHAPATIPSREDAMRAIAPPPDAPAQAPETAPPANAPPTNLVKPDPT